MDAERQQRIIRHLVQKLATLYREMLVFEEFQKELKENEGRVGILEDLNRIRSSPETQGKYDAYFQSLDSLISEEKIPDQALQELIRRLGLNEDKPN